MATSPDPISNQRPSSSFCPTPDYAKIREEAGPAVESAIKNMVTTLNEYIRRKGA